MRGWTHSKPTHHQLAVLRLQLAERLCVASTEILRYFTLKDEKYAPVTHQRTASLENPISKSFSPALCEQEEVERMQQQPPASTQKFCP